MLDGMTDRSELPTKPSPSDAPAPIIHDSTAERFEVRIGGWPCRCDYRLIDGVMHLIHTEVPPALEGRGIAARLAQAALDHAQANGLKVLPRCSYVRAYMRRHPQTQSLLA
jgi:predicted GNAT family acetyltransferase